MPLILIILAFHSNASAQKLILTGSLAEMYDDNTNSSSEDPQADYITNIMLGFGVNLEGRTQTLQLLGHTYQQLYYEQSELNNNSQDVVLNYTKEFTSRDRFTLNDTFGHYPEAQEFQDMFGQPEGRNGYYTNSLNLAFIKDMISDFSINIHYNNIITRGTSEAVNDSMSNGAGFRLNYGFNAFNIIFLFYDYNITQYESTVEDEENETIQHTAGLGYQHFFTRQLSITTSGGIGYVATQDDTQYSPYVNLSLIDNIDENNTLNISVSRTYQSTLLTNEVYDSWIFSALFTRQVSDRFMFSFSAFYQYGKTVSSLSDQKSQIFGITTSGSYALSENISVRALYTYTRNINEQARPVTQKIEYDRNQIEISANAEY